MPGRPWGPLVQKKLLIPWSALVDSFRESRDRGTGNRSRKGRLEGKGERDSQGKISVTGSYESDWLGEGDQPLSGTY